MADTNHGVSRKCAGERMKVTEKKRNWTDGMLGVAEELGMEIPQFPH